MKLNNKQILIFILIITFLFSNNSSKGNYYNILINSFKIFKRLNTIKRGWNLGTSLMIINKDLNSKKNLKLLDDIIKNHNKKKNKKETNK